jgi:hypothetical protein
VLGDLSNALRLNRPQEVAEHSTTLAKKLEDVEEEVVRWAPPFGVLLNQVGDAYTKFSGDSLKTQLEIVNWYVERDQEIQAVTLLREWLVSWVCQRLGFELYKRKIREDVEYIINATSRRRQDKEPIESPLTKDFAMFKDYENILNVWDQLSDLRNDVAHCGMREKAKGTRRIIVEIEEIAQQVQQLYASSFDKGEM